MLRRILLVAALGLVLGACGQAPAAQGPAATASGAEPTGQPIKVVASTSIIADVVGQVGGDRVAVSTLVPLGGDTHSFAPAPQDIARVAEAQVVFVSGAGYEEFLANLVESAGGQARVVELSEGLALRELSEEEAGAHEGEEHADEAHAEESRPTGEAQPTGEAHAEEGDHDHGGLDPHTWTDPANVKYWTAGIAEALGAIDGANADRYQENAARYNGQLDELGTWMGEQFAQVPADRRLLVTDHAVFGYMADRYGLKQVGTLLPGFSSAAEPSAQELAALQETIKDLGVRAIFVGDVGNQSLAQQIASDTGTHMVTILTESLTPAGGPGATYIDYMRYNTTTIAEALR